MKELYKILALTLFSSCFNCTEEIPLETQDFEDVLVVEATLTNELKHQEVKLSRTYFLEDSNLIIEDNASVSVSDSLGNTYNFAQNSEGTYVSNEAFEASANTNYTLLITTSDGKNYTSSETALSPVSQIDELYAAVSSGGTSANKIQVLLNSNNESTNAQYFRYEFTETHKIVVPLYGNSDALITNIVNNGLEYEIVIVPKTENKETCYTTNSSTEIIQASTSQLDNNIIDRFVIRTIEKDDVLIRQRYTILVKQFVQSIESYNFYKIINSLSANESLLSESQSGYVIGNVRAVNNKNERVIGFFEVATVSSKRLYFNYEDLNIPQPPYPYDCLYRTNEISEFVPYHFNYNENHLILDYSLNGGGIGVPNQRAQLFNFLSPFKNYQYIGGEFPVYSIVSPKCGDCTSYSSNIRPDFWED
ncbi:DUF4249 domain-containing protein [Bizionia gelidisalsuginis]|uniref:DUF4249 domain-containing protein n=1 Tax=Bizionia gelidisalsuginis TaxID=291188 RepID=A0ABY3M9U5_9FLAO|nr:DUF4249 domain-containing protein [Bizionia gelidisalsuginis]TYC12016.1 DUF4249 domain-containing protein [Bizionia gelidisalsuginis]